MKELLFSITAEDCEFQTTKGSGKGGQHRNKVETAVRCIHHESKAVGYSQDERSQWQNKKLAFERMAKSKEFQKWIKMEASRKLRDKNEEYKTEERVKELMRDENLRIEVKDKNGKWVEWREEDEPTL